MKCLYRNFCLIDGTGKEPVEQAAMAVEDGRILWAGPAKQWTGQADQEICLGGGYVMPGLAECHTHMTLLTLNIPEQVKLSYTETVVGAVQNLENWLKQGVTLIRDVGSFKVPSIELVLRDMVRDGKIPGPTVYASGRIITMTGGHGCFIDRTYDGVDEVRKAAREIIWERADLIKTIATGGVGTEGTDVNAYQYSEEELRAIVIEAKKAGKKVAVHAHGTQGIKNALRAGVDSIEHGTLLDEEGIELMVQNKAYLVPTFAITRQMMENARENPGSIPESMLEKEKTLAGLHEANFARAYKAGVKIACGTDVNPRLMPWATARELGFMMEASGMSAMEAIVSATGAAADLIGAGRDYGTLEAGKYADFLVMDENPLEDIGAVCRLREVYKTGRRVER